MFWCPALLAMSTVAEKHPRALTHCRNYLSDFVAQDLMITTRTGLPLQVRPPRRRRDALRVRDAGASVAQL